MRRGEAAASYKLQAASSTEMPRGWEHLVDESAEVPSGKNSGVTAISLQLVAYSLQLARERVQ